MSPEERAKMLGHEVKSDPPARMTAVERWTCVRCGAAVLDYNGNVYGSAVSNRCWEKSL